MRICRYEQAGRAGAALYFDDFLVPVTAAAGIYQRQTGRNVDVPGRDDLLEFLPPDGAACEACERLYAWTHEAAEGLPPEAKVAREDARLLVPIPRPSKLFLLAGNYAAHIEEGGGIAAERAETFPYVFMKPPTTTLTHPGDPLRIPAVSPRHIDWELELAVIIGRGGKGISEGRALEHVAGYTVINDISDRRFRPNPNRKQREKDVFFDWLHGKWHDGFCPCGPCVATPATVGDPQQLGLVLKVDGEVKQDASTAAQVFPVAAVIEFISSFVTLEPGDIISTGTPAGVGNTTGTYLRAGNRIEATILSIGTLRTPVIGPEEDG